jgi:ABC-type sugar transport system permease subunit
LLTLYTILLIFSAGLENVDNTLYEAANVDGCNKWQKFTKVTLPGIKNQFVICLFTTLVGYMNLYGQNFILGSNTPDQDAIKTAIFRIQDILMGSSRGYGIAASMAICLGVIIAFVGAIQMIATSDRKGGNKYEKAYMAWEKSQ